MSTTGLRNFRPRFHFSPEKGWINDPNGLVFYQGQYHLFAQHYPHETVWGPMHWAHAVSNDLIRWEHLPIALYPDADGYIFSGSAAIDARNASGFGTTENPPLIAMYTCHGEKETQAIAYSTDGIHFEKYAQNPVIPNPGLVDFRDPKLFWNSVHNCWSMVLAATDRVHFYRSTDFKNWTKTGEFGPSGNHATGIWECPDLVPFTFNGKPMYMLIVSMTTSLEDGRNNPQYFLGEFDGDSFICTVPFAQMEKIDDGWDNYAGVTFNNLEKPVLIGWGTNWEYAKELPTSTFCGQMTLPRELAIKETPQGPRLSSTPIAYNSYLGSPRLLEKTDALDTETFCLEITGSSAASIVLSNEEGQTLRFGVDAQNQFFLDRTHAGANQFHPSFSLDAFSRKFVKRYFDGSYEIRFLFDVSMLEMFIDQGTRNITAVVYPDSPYSKISIVGNAQATLFPMCI